MAWRFNHRASADLDVFVPEDFDAARLADDLSLAGPGLQITSIADRTIYAVVDGIPASVLGYRHPSLHPPERVPELALPLASPEDLVAMKLAAIGGRSAAKDFWDLDVMLRGGVCAGELAVALDVFRKKFPAVDPSHVVRALAWFGDADVAPLPRGLAPIAWRQIKERFQQRVRALFGAATGGA